MHAVQAMQRVHGFFVKCAGDVQKCADSARKTKSHEIFRFTASTLDIPSRWNPRAKQSRTVALLAALCAAALFEPFHRADKKKNQNTNVFWFFLVQ